jgi:hypothetical protein
VLGILTNRLIDLDGYVGSLNGTDLPELEVGFNQLIGGLTMLAIVKRHEVEKSMTMAAMRHMHCHDAGKSLAA